jgi:hypothetical protein
MYEYLYAGGLKHQGRHVELGRQTSQGRATVQGFRTSAVCKPACLASPQ